jgi:hypothetical protein
MYKLHTQNCHLQNPSTLISSIDLLNAQTIQSNLYTMSLDIIGAYIERQLKRILWDMHCHKRLRMSIIIYKKKQHENNITPNVNLLIPKKSMHALPTRVTVCWNTFTKFWLRSILSYIRLVWHHNTSYNCEAIRV